MRIITVLVTTFVLVAMTGCECSDSTCQFTADCAEDQLCIRNRCVIPSGVDGSVDAARRESETGIECANRCGVQCCSMDQLCVDGTLCAQDLGPCSNSADCAGDSLCDRPQGRCIPWGIPPARTHDTTCTRMASPGAFAPTVQCEFDHTPAGDAFPMHLHVLSTPMVADFAIDRDPDSPARPSIVAVFDDGEDGGDELPTGVIRILDGQTCTQEAELGSLQMVSHSSPPAIGDLDGDGRPEIVANKANGGLVAFRYDDANGAWEVFWRSTDAGTPYEPTGGGWAGPSIADLDDDGVPEVLRGGIVLSNLGVMLDQSLAGLHASHSAGIFAVVADVDSDSRVELVSGNGVWQWESGTWVMESYVTTETAVGHVALADFGAFPGAENWPAETPEIAVISRGTARVQTLDGSVVFGPIGLPGGGTGGPPTVADFDGDGRPEFASAGANAYSVFDLDCGPNPSGACASGALNGVSWSQPSQDASSNVTGSSVFDFEGDGRAEAVYGDECFLRVYDGELGTVLFSQARSSCTWYENPVIADVDGDFNAELVIGNNYNCGSADFGSDCTEFNLGPRQTDPLFPGLRCRENQDCLSGECNEGLCRCSSDVQCCAGLGCDRAFFVCEAPPDGTPGTGDTCRASRPRGTLGIRVFRDAMDRWVRSRAIWNQHAYFVTNVDENGHIPQTSLARQNWVEPGLNNFRQNAQGAAVPGAAPDITSRPEALDCALDGSAELRSTICNRGSDDVGVGVSVGFYEGDPRLDGTLICRSRTSTNLAPGACESVRCDWTGVPAEEEPGVDVWVIADDEQQIFECRESNNVTVYRDVRCGILF